MTSIASIFRSQLTREFYYKIHVLFGGQSLDLKWSRCLLQFLKQYLDNFTTCSKVYENVQKVQKNLLATTRHKDILRVAQDETAMHFYPFQK